MAFDLNNIGALAMSVGSWVLLVGAMLIALAIGGGIAYYFMWKRSYDKYVIVIFERIKTKNGTVTPHIITMKEKGKIKYDKKLKKWYFYLRTYRTHMGEEELQNFDENRTLDVPSIPFGTRRLIFIERLGVRKFAFGELQIEGDIKVIVSNADVAEATRSFDLNARTFGKQNNQVLAFVLYVVVCVLILILIIYLIQKFENIQKSGELMAQSAQTYLKAIEISKGVTIPSTAPS